MFLAYCRRTLFRFLEEPLAKCLVRVGIAPGLITLTGLALAGVVAYLLSQGWFLVGGLVLLASGLLDTLDGSVARLGGKATNSGAFLDSVSDRVGEVVVLGGLLAFYVAEERGDAAVPIYLTMALSFLVSYLRARGEALAIDNSLGLVTRPERILLLVIGLVSGLVLPFLWAIVGLSAVTSVQRFWRGFRRHS